MARMKSSRSTGVAVIALAASWAGIVATSQPRWSVQSTASIPRFTLDGGQSRSFRVVVRPSAAAVRGATASKLFTSIHARVQSQVVGSPRPATVAIELVHLGQGGTVAHHPNEAFHGHDWTCATVAQCTHSYTLTARWPDAMANARADVSIALDANAQSRGSSDTPAGAAVDIEVTPLP
jgi:hypothetical protein